MTTPSLPIAVPDIDPDHAQDEAAYRSGAAARLAGVPVETLRVWERRHHVTAPQRSNHGQRLYSLAEIRRLSLVKQLVDLGNQIGTIASLSDQQLVSMLSVARASPLPSSSDLQRPLRLALVGQALAARMKDCDQHGLAIDVVASCPQLSGAPLALHAIRADVLVLELSEMTQTSLHAIDNLKQALGANGVVILYRFGSSGTIRQWREAGHVVAHAPSDTVEIALLCRSALPGMVRFMTTPDGASIAGHATEKATAKAVLPARRFDDQTLAQLATISSNLECECPRHLAELLLTLVSFERYSAQCASSNEADAALHSDLEHSAAQARVLLELALERLAISEGIQLPQTTPFTTG